MIRLIIATFFRLSFISNKQQHLLCMSVTQSLVACLNNCDFSYIPITSCLLKQINKYFYTFSLHVMFHCFPLLCKLWPLYTAREALGRAAGFCYPYNVLCVGDWRKVQYIFMIGLSFPFSSLCKDPSGAKTNKQKNTIVTPFQSLCSRTCTFSNSWCSHCNPSSPLLWMSASRVDSEIPKAF